MRRRAFSFLTVLALAGCGGSGGSSSSSTSSANESYAIGVKSLGSALDSGTNRATNLQSAQKAFDNAFSRNPNDPRIAMGYALSTTALDATTLATAVEGKSATARLSLLGGTGTRLAAKGTSLAALLPMLAARPRTRIEGAALLSLASDLHKIVDRLPDSRVDALEANPLVLTYGGTPGVTIKVGAVEGYALRSAAKAALGLVDGTLAYTLDPGTYDPNGLFLTQFSAQVAAGTDIAPAAYLPTGSFGTPTAAAGTLLADLATEWTGTANDGETALARLGTRNGTGWLTDLVPLSDDEKASITLSLDELKAALAGPTSVPISLPNGTTTSLTVDLSAPLAHPPADLRAFYPTLRPIPAPPAGTTPTTTLTPVAGSVADPTLGGLVPGGLPTPLLYGRSLTVDTTTTQGTVATWAFPLSGLSGL